MTSAWEEIQQPSTGTRLLHPIRSQEKKNFMVGDVKKILQDKNITSSTNSMCKGAEA